VTLILHEYISIRRRFSFFCQIVKSPYPRPSIVDRDLKNSPGEVSPTSYRIIGSKIDFFKEQRAFTFIQEILQVSTAQSHWDIDESSLLMMLENNYSKIGNV
jgi:hypothetical protein